MDAEAPGFVLTHATSPRILPPPGAATPEATPDQEILAICEGASVEPAQPTCHMTEAQSIGGLRFADNRLRGGVKWCAGDEPLPWVSSARAAKLDTTYVDLGLTGRPDGASPALTKIISHNFVILEIAERPFLVATNGQVRPLERRSEDGERVPATAVTRGGYYPPTKGVLLRMPDGAEPIFAIDRDGTVREVPRPHPLARFVGWSTTGGGHDSLWRWSSPEAGGGETWAVLHHAPDGQWAGDPEPYAVPSLCAEAPSPDLRFSSGGRGVRIAVDGDRLCIDPARGDEDHRYWRTPSGDDAAKVGRDAGKVRRARSAERVTCSRWRLEQVPGPQQGEGGHPSLAVRYLER